MIETGPVICVEAALKSNKHTLMNQNMTLKGEIKYMKVNKYLQKNVLWMNDELGQDFHGHTLVGLFKI